MKVNSFKLYINMLYLNDLDLSLELRLAWDFDIPKAKKVLSDFVVF